MYDDYEDHPKEEKEVIEGYTVEASFWINGKRLIYAKDETGKKEMPYMKIMFVPDPLFGHYENGLIFDSYTEAMKQFADDLKVEAVILETENKALGAEKMSLFTLDDVVPDDMTEDLTGKVVAMKPKYLADGKNYLPYQLFYVTGGNGALPDARGRACFCKRLRDGIGTRIERYEVLGIVPDDKLPDFAKATLEKLKNEKTRTGGER